MQQKYPYYIIICNISIFIYDCMYTMCRHVLALEGLLSCITGILYSFRIQYDSGSIYVTRGTEHINLHEVLVRVSYGLQK